MTTSESVVSFDVDAVIAAIEDALDDADSLHVVAPFTPETYELAYVDDLTHSFYRDDEEMTAHFDRIHEYAGIDFSEIGLVVDDLFPIANGVEYIATGLDYLTVVRVYTGREGLFVSLDPGADPTVVVEAMRDAVDADLGAAETALSTE
ncbi:hypothetical protein [Halobaculum limi]|uniref:hypothetical protein n=1 Tax=Halobaculum limi TaxID=3031916 RepID=UPI002404ACC3|nr:hypothetical protein [Halobaculum sp. YSMS11]